MLKTYDKLVSEGLLDIELPEDEYREKVDEEVTRIATVDIGIGENKTYEHTYEEEVMAFVNARHSEAMRAIELMRAEPGTEGIFSLARNAILGITNSVVMVGNLLTTGLFHGWRDFKRSELTEYVDSNRITAAILKRVNMNEVGHIPMPVPQGMKTDYMTAINFLSNYLNIADMPRVTSTMDEIASSVLKDIKRGIYLSSGISADHVNVLRLSELNDLFCASWEIFESNPSNFQEIPFSKAFKSSNDFKIAIERTQDFDSDLRKVARVHDNVESIEKTFKHILSLKNSLNDESLQTLANLARDFATCISNYATVINDVNRMQHNLTDCLRYVRKYTGY